MHRSGGPRAGSHHCCLLLLLVTYACLPSLRAFLSTVASIHGGKIGSAAAAHFKSILSSVALLPHTLQALGGKVMKCSWGRHPNTPPSGVQTSLMLAAAAGLNPLAMGSAGVCSRGCIAVPCDCLLSVAAASGTSRQTSTSLCRPLARLMAC